MSTWAQPGRLRRPGRGLGIEEVQTAANPLISGNCVFKRAEPALTDHSSEVFELARQYDLPYVMTWCIDGSHYPHCVGFSYYDAAFDLASLVVKRGHRRIALCNGFERSNERARLRAAGTCAALKAAGLSLGASLVTEHPFNFEGGGRRSAFSRPCNGPDGADLWHGPAGDRSDRRMPSPWHPGPGGSIDYWFRRYRTRGDRGPAVDHCEGNGRPSPDAGVAARDEGDRAGEPGCGARYCAIAERSATEAGGLDLAQDIGCRVGRQFQRGTVNEWTPALMFGHGIKVRYDAVLRQAAGGTAVMGHHARASIRA